MLTTINMSELQQIVNANYGDPHRVLGMHEFNDGGEDCLVVRAFIPQADEITVVDDAAPENRYEMEKIHLDGFFECVIKDRQVPFRYKLDISAGEDTHWETYDAYAFPSTIDETDVYLFNNGTNYQVYEKLGANPTVIDGVSGVAFGVWAPNARRVSVIGEFNSWDGRRHAMRLLHEGSGVWEIFIPGLVDYDKYKFEIKAADGAIIQKQDPYGKFAELRPSTASLVFDINKHEWNDAAWYEGLENRDKFDAPMNIYEVHLGSWKKVEEEENRFLSYLELADQLIPYVKEMGYTHIELMPVEEHPYDGSWGYQVTGYYAPTSRYGNPDEFMTFVDKCHQAGIGVFLDWVPAHFPKDAHGLARFDGSALYEHADPRQGEHAEWGTLIYNFGRSEVKNFLIANALYWVEKYHIDGLRVDAVSSMLYLNYAKEDGQWIPNKYGGSDNLDAIEFLKHLNSIIVKRNPHVHMIAEESTSWPYITKSVEDGGLGFTLKWNMGWMNDFLEYMGKDPVYRKYHHNNLTFGMVYAYTEKFILVLSHDEVVHGKKSMLDKMPGDLWQKFANLRAAYGFMFGFPGKKLLFMGGEFGQFIEWNEKRPLDWFLLEYQHHQTMLDYVKCLNHIYLENEALWRNDNSAEGFEWIDANDGNRSIYSFIRKGSKREDTLVVICNFTPNTYEGFRQGMPFEGNWHEILNSDAAQFGGSGVINVYPYYTERIESHGREWSVVVNVPPLSVLILKCV
ncbi:MAG: 1,4-alpha-glucan branching protein GlgB [Firmicutes bacterium]|nr:1,4-alpha-glucan branching protein GlgB [Bacillota bacterium]